MRYCRTLGDGDGDRDRDRDGDGDGDGDGGHVCQHSAITPTTVG